MSYPLNKTHHLHPFHKKLLLVSGLTQSTPTTHSYLGTAFPIHRRRTAGHRLSSLRDQTGVDPLMHPGLMPVTLSSVTAHR